MSSILKKRELSSPPPPPRNITRGAHQNNYSPSHLPSFERTKEFHILRFVIFVSGRGGGYAHPCNHARAPADRDRAGVPPSRPGRPPGGAPAADDFFTCEMAL
ncbi:hypothetical protein CEXT_598311 [Caerostris extrusa]|uniref:Uncharacterized protein n=1 Tax=Caerostris extrusa TaxID=172846 RepID=A0AAV4NB34_CAEEX|nr:hypothetical protein CEXT_598311 [Caerostris extrusa]